MIKSLKKFTTAFIVLALLVSIFILSCGFAFESRLPKRVTINGLNVGGLTYSAAKAKVRGEIESELRQKKLIISGGSMDYVFTYPELGYKDNLTELLKTAKKDGNYKTEINYYLCGLNEVAAAICFDESVSVVEPYAEFSRFNKAFTYHEGSDGKTVDTKKLKSDICAALCGNFEPISLSYVPAMRTKTLGEVKQKTKLLAAFATYFDDGNLSRSSNIRLAASKLNGFILQAGKTLSFNDVVGDRVKSRGFLPAKIIENGEFTEGVGGGVCQVSTTLYNAALICGLKIEEYHPHSLAVGYVPPSRDAMVSGRQFDLRIKNPFAEPVYIRAKTSGGSVRFEIYGGGDGAEYSLCSSVTGSVPRDEEQTDDPEKAREGKDGVISEGYLVVKRDGYEKKVLLRKDKYLPVKKISYIPDESL